jgi:hexosaminidase
LASNCQGWRIEIKKYPKLALIGGIGNYGEEYTPAQFYTQEEIKEVVTYALERNIHIIPEIDMPGHASAASKAYPEFSGGGSPKYPGYTFNPGKDSVYTYLTDILKEVDALFPSQVIHLGGDEVHYGNQDWNTNKDIQDLMKHEKMKNLKDVENYFFQRMADSLLLIHNKVAAWDEVADSKLSPEQTIVFFWRQNRPEQLQKSLDRKFNIVLCPRLPMYLDYAQDTLQVHGVDWRKFSCNSYQKVYSFSPQDIPVKYPQNCNILGIQANLWTERIETEDRLDYMLFPRIVALAENAWTKEMNKNIDSFNVRLKKQFDLYKKDHIYYSDPFSPKETGEPVR